MIPEKLFDSIVEYIDARVIHQGHQTEQSQRRVQIAYINFRKAALNHPGLAEVVDIKQ